MIADTTSDLEGGNGMYPMGIRQAGHQVPGLYGWQGLRTVGAKGRIKNEKVTCGCPIACAIWDRAASESAGGTLETRVIPQV